MPANPQNAVAAVPFPNVSPWPSVAGFRSVSPVASIGPSGNVPKGMLIITGSGNASYSTDNGTTWILGNGVPAMRFQTAAYSPLLRRFCAGQGNAFIPNGVITSDDGITWEQQTFPAFPIAQIIWIPGLNVFAAIVAGGAPNDIYFSIDGKNWASVHATSGPALETIAWNGAVACAMQISNLPVSSELSATGSIWSTHLNVCPLQSFNFLASNEAGQFVLVTATQANFPFNNYDVFTSPDGITFTQHVGALPAPGTDWGSIIWTGTAYVLPGLLAAGLMARSTDGIAWTYHAPAYAEAFPEGAFNGSVCVFANNVTGNTIVSPDDGVTWNAGGNYAATLGAIALAGAYA